MEKAEPVQVCFTLRLRDHQSMWMQDECKVYMDSYMAPNGSCFMVTWTIFKNHLLEVNLTQIQGIMALRTFTTVDLSILSCVRTHENWYLVEGLVTCDFTLHLRIRDHITWFWRCIGIAFGHFLLDSHNYMVTTFGSCVKWPLIELVARFYPQRHKVICNAQLLSMSWS